MTTGSIVLDICHERLILPEEFFGPRRNKRLVEARKAAIEAFRAAGFSLRGTARMIRRDHTTVCYWLHPKWRDRKRNKMRQYRKGFIAQLTP